MTSREKGKSDERRNSFLNALKNVKVTSNATPGEFDDSSDIIGDLHQKQLYNRADALDMFSNSISNPEHLKALNKVHIDRSPADPTDPSGLYRSVNNSLIIKVNNHRSEDELHETVAHELGHHLYEHGVDEQPGDRIPLAKIGKEEAEADSYANPHKPVSNLYTHAVVGHLLGGCSKDHGPEHPHEALVNLGKGYLESMKNINPHIGRQLENLAFSRGNNNGN
jgi:hypothetical protein